MASIERAHASTLVQSFRLRWGLLYTEDAASGGTTLNQKPSLCQTPAVYCSMWYIVMQMTVVPMHRHVTIDTMSVFTADNNMVVQPAGFASHAASCVH